MSLPRTSPGRLRRRQPGLGLLGVLETGQGDPRPPWPDPAEAAGQLLELRRRMLLEAGPHNVPVLMLYNDETSLLVLGEDSRLSRDGNGWSVLKTVEWTRAYARSMNATRFELNLVTFCHTSAVVAEPRKLPATVSIVADAARGRSIRSLAILGDPEANRIDGFADIPLDLGPVGFLTEDLLLPGDPLLTGAPLEKLSTDGAAAPRPMTEPG